LASLPMSDPPVKNGNQTGKYHTAQNMSIQL
jgi:hypothetical protein